MSMNPEVIAAVLALVGTFVITTGATVSECARVLQTAGAAQVLCAAVAARGDGPK
mgnify:CR=1 FL=1